MKHPTPWVVYSKRGSHWIKDADHQWVGVFYNEKTAHRVVALMNGVRATDLAPTRTITDARAPSARTHSL